VISVLWALVIAWWSTGQSTLADQCSQHQVRSIRWVPEAAQDDACPAQPDWRLLSRLA
jgi:hypothetical protein